MPLADPSVLYSPGDFTAIRKRIFEDSLNAVKNRFPIENSRYSLSLEDVDYENPRDFSLKEQKAAVQNDQSLSWKMRGSWVLRDKATGNVVSKSSKRTVMNVPYMTERGTFIRNGTETTLPLQMRLVPGVYTRMGEDNIAKAHINARPGTGNTVMMQLNPAKPVFRVSVGTRNYDLFPLLKHLGVTDEEMIAAWGKDLYNANKEAFMKAGGWYKAKTAADTPDPNDPWEKAAKDVLGGELDPDNTMSTFGTAYTKVDPQLLLASSKRLVGLAKGEHSGDNRDSMENQRFFGPADYISERIRLDAGGLLRNLLWRTSRYGDAQRIPSSPLSKYVDGLFTESKLAQSIEETNLLDAYKRATMVTRMGEGGIGSIESAPMSARLVHNTYKGFIDPVASPESLRVGLDTQIARSARRGPDGLMYAPLINSKTGQREYFSTLESSRVAVAFPEYASSKSPLIPAMVGNDIEMIPKSKVAYFVPNGDSLFATASNFVPIKSGIKAGRLLMAQKHQTQAMSIKDRMAPYVQSLDPDGSGKSVEEVDSGILGAVRADQPGKVVKVTKDDITVLQADGTKRTYSLYNNFPLNRKSVVNNTAEVKPGDMVDKGTLLASSSYTDKNGVAAMGTQLRTGWLSFKGWNYLDAIVVSESAAKKLTSEHFYHEGVDRDEGTSIGRDRYISAFPGKFNRDQLATIDDNGAVKPGTIVKKGDPLVLAMSLRPGGPGTGYRALHKDVSAVWEHDFPGEVTDVVDAKDGARVYVKAWVPLQTGDKLATRFANKGTAALVVPDERMPRAADGRPLEVLFSPTGIVSRVNSAAMIEAALGKVSEKTGKRYILPGFGTDLVKFAKKELKEAGLTDREDVTDPDTGRIIPGVFVGNSYITKFHHTSESKGGARATGAYTADEQPATGGHDGAKTLGGLVLGAFAGHGASEVLKDMKLIKGQKNTDFWRDFKMGKTPAMPGTPLVYKRFLASLEASGIHVTRDGDNTNIFAMTNADVRKQARAELKNATTYDEKKFLPMKGGLFDPAIFGQNGDQWAYIPVDEPILNPVMDDVVCNFLNLKKAELDEVISGMRKLPNGMTGGEGLRKQLASLNLDTMIENAKNTIRSGPVSRRDKAVKTLRWVSAMKKHDATPDQFMLDEVPVLPPRYRRITRSGDLNMVADANYLYKELLDARNDLREAKEAGLPDELLGFGRKRVTDAFRAVTGLADPSDTKLKESGVSGLLKWVFGKGSPKMGALQRLVIGGKLDVAGRGVINIDPRLGMDEVGVPENQAWDLYRDFIIRKLVQGGMNPLMATKAAVEHSPSAKEAMLQVMKDRPLIATRAPALHKYSVQAFRPKLVVGNTMKLNSVVERGFNADFDGNCVDYDTEIFLQSALDNPVSQSILNSVRANGAREVSLGETTMITEETTAIFASTTRNNFYYNGPIGKLPRIGEPKKDRNGADVYELPEDIMVWSYDHATNEFGWHRATHFTVEQDCEVCDVRIGTLHVKMSTNDSMSVFDQKTGELVKQAPEKSLGAFVPICRELPKMTCMERTGTFNAGWLHGMMLGDGWLSGNYVGFTKLEEAKLNTFISRLSEHLGTEIHYNVYEGKASSGKFGDSRKIHMSDKAVVAWASDLEMYDKKANIRDTPDRAALHKWIHPTYLYIRSDEYLWGLLSGLIDSDGSVTRAVKKGTGKVVIGVTYSTCSPSMRDTLIGLAHRLGIKAGYSEGVHKKGKGRKVESVEYCVMLSGPDVQANLGNISCVGHNETTRMEEWKTQEPYVDNNDVIPMSDDESKLLIKLFPHRLFPSFYVIAYKKQATRRTLMKYLWMKEAKDKGLDNLRRRVLATGVVWYPVTEVTPLGKREVFDLCVPDTKVFVVNNGPVVWDTMTYYVPVSNKAVEEAYRVMMPSKNLLAARDFKSMPELQEELVSGAWFASHRKNTPPKAVFNTTQEALQAYLHGQIKADDNVIVKELTK